MKLKFFRVLIPLAFVLIACNKKENTEKFDGFTAVSTNKETATFYIDTNTVKKHNNDLVSFNMIRVLPNGYAIQNAETDCINNFKSLEGVKFRDDGTSNDKFDAESLILPNQENPEINALVALACEKVKNIKLAVRATTTLEYRNGIAFLPNENEPFTGKYEKHYSTGQKMIETRYIDGKEAKKNEYSLDYTMWKKDGTKNDYCFDLSDINVNNALLEAFKSIGINKIKEDVFSDPSSCYTFFLNQKIYLLESSCQAHNCPYHNITLLYSLDDNRIVGTYVQDNQIGRYVENHGINEWIGEKKWIGSPSKEEKNLIHDYENSTSILSKYLAISFKNKLLPEEPLPIELLQNKEMQLRINDLWKRHIEESCKEMGESAKYESDCDNIN